MFGLFLVCLCVSHGEFCSGHPILPLQSVIGREKPSPSSQPNLLTPYTSAGWTKKNQQRFFPLPPSPPALAQSDFYRKRTFFVRAVFLGPFAFSIFASLSYFLALVWLGENERGGANFSSLLWAFSSPPPLVSLFLRS